MPSGGLAPYASPGIFLQVAVAGSDQRVAQNPLQGVQRLVDPWGLRLRVRKYRNVGPGVSLQFSSVQQQGQGGGLPSASQAQGYDLFCRHWFPSRRVALSPWFSPFSEIARRDVSIKALPRNRPGSRRTHRSGRTAPGFPWPGSSPRRRAGTPRPSGLNSRSTRPSRPGSRRGRGTQRPPPLLSPSAPFRYLPVESGPTAPGPGSGRWPAGIWPRSSWLRSCWLRTSPGLPGVRLRPPPQSALLGCRPSRPPRPPRWSGF